MQHLNRRQLSILLPKRNLGYNSYETLVIIAIEDRNSQMMMLCIAPDIFVKGCRNCRYAAPAHMLIHFQFNLM